MDQLQAMVEYLVKELVDEPEAVQVQAAEGRGITVYEITVAQGDLGKVIGREGRIASALRQLTRAAATKFDRRATVEIMSDRP